MRPGQKAIRWVQNATSSLKPTLNTLPTFPSVRSKRSAHDTVVTLIGQLPPLPLSDALSLNTLILTTTEWGGAMSYGHDGRILQRVFAYPTVGLSMVDAMQLMRIPQPDHIKMDVDGIEHLILKGGILALRAVKSVLIEINDEFDAQAGDAGRYLRDAGLSLKAKRHADCFDSATSPAKRTFNQIWCK